jgi:regulator of sirC expression with transglutaminase-like and TPR domain
LRGREDDDAKALERFEALGAMSKAPVETWRSIGLVRRARGDHEEARRAFARYLELKPGAGDAEIIRTYIES